MLQMITTHFLVLWLMVNEHATHLVVFCLTECLAGCLQMRTRQIIEPSIIGRTCEIIRHLPMMDSESAAMIVKALSNAFHLNYMLLDQLMLNLRKTIWKLVF